MGLFSSIFDFINTGRAAKSISNANIAAEHGVLNATGEAQSGVGDAVARGSSGVTDASNAARGDVAGATHNANSQLDDLWAIIQERLAPYLAAGEGGLSRLQSFLDSNDSKFTFDKNQFFNSDAFNFERDQGINAIQSAASAQGLGASGAVLKDMTGFATGTAAKYYQQAFDMAQRQFKTNTDTTMGAIKDLIGAGGNALALNQQGAESVFGQKAKNTLGEGYFQADNENSTAKFLASLGLTGAQLQGQFGMTGAKQAGDYAVAAGGAHASGILGQGAVVNDGISSLASMLVPLLTGGGAAAGGGGNGAATLASIFGSGGKGGGVPSWGMAGGGPG